jgi:hypothetical protein
MLLYESIDDGGEEFGIEICMLRSRVKDKLKELLVISSKYRIGFGG